MQTASPCHVVNQEQDMFAFIQPFPLTNKPIPLYTFYAPTDPPARPRAVREQFFEQKLAQLRNESTSCLVDDIQTCLRWQEYSSIHVELTEVRKKRLRKTTIGKGVGKAGKKMWNGWKRWIERSAWWEVGGCLPRSGDRIACERGH